ncbi:hypothetical protein J5X84_42930 [Streptosporangiaceae bacterium NEAU-GS5]|nr:hypothetical protein [Streptosporangiaceae bacterium NEAU-GS5]
MTRPVIHATLTGHGRIPWDRARTLLDGFTCAWADLDGFNLGPASQEPPLTTHLWAWRDQVLFRARMDGAECILGRLDLSGGDVQVAERHCTTWPHGEGRVSVADDWRSRPVTLYEVAGQMPLTFARLDSE